MILFHSWIILQKLVEVFNIYNPSIDHPLGMDWNGTHFFVTDLTTDTVHIYHDGTFELIDTIALGYDPIGLVVVGNYFYVASHESPYNIYKYSFDGSLIATFSTGIHCYDLAYDGNYIYLTRYSDTKISKLDPTDCTLIETYAVEEEYAGLTYDSLNNVFWGVGGFSDKIYQLDTTGFNKTGIQYDTPTPLGDYGLCFDEVHLVMNSWSTDKFYKTIINFRPDLPSNPIPSHNAIDISVNPTLSVEVSDPNGDELTVTFYNATDDSIIGTDVVSGGHGNALITWSSLSKNTEYDWYVIVDDGIDSRESSTWSFITEKESPPTGIPGYNVLIIFSILIGFGILLFQIKKRHR